MSDSSPKDHGILQRLLGRSSGVERKVDDERGSALIISLMIMVILTMLGVTFLVLSEQENKISVNSRDHAQALYLAEAAVNVGITWFNDPSASNTFKPTDAQMNYTLRKGRHFKEDWDNDRERAAGITDSSDLVKGSIGNVYTGGNLGGTGTSRFDKPFRGAPEYTLWGRRDTPDVLICGSATLDVDGDGTEDCSDDSITYIQRLSNALLMSTSLRNDGHKSNDFGVLEIEQIRVYRPPVDFDFKTRYGIATIEAIATKKVRGQVVARRSVREVIQEIPFPGPGGAIETEGLITFDGSVGVHWGAVVSASTSDDINLGSSGTNNFADTGVARQTASRFGFHWTINPAAEKLPGGGVGTWLSEAVGTTKNHAAVGSGWAAPGFGDPWLLFRARRNVIVDNTVVGGVQRNPYTPVNSISTNGALRFRKDRSANWSHMFQRQIIRFPPIDYDIWKSIAQSGQKGMYYFKWIDDENYKQDGVGPTRTWTTWMSTYKTGVFFFDTQDSMKPLDDLSNLTPAHGWEPNLYIEGFIYLNSAAFDSSGGGNAPRRELNMPGEPFLDDGIDFKRPGQDTGDNCICLRYDAEEGCVLGARPIGFDNCATNDLDGDDCNCPDSLLATMDDGVAAAEAATFRNGIWDSDIDNNGVTDAISNIQNNPDWDRFIDDNDDGGYESDRGHGYATGILPGYPAARRSDQGGQPSDWKRDPRFLNNIADLGGTNADRQPHEPFVNLDSETDGATVADWADQDDQHSLTVNYRADGEAIEKDSGGDIVRATTRARDATGALYGLQPHINGVFYGEGAYTGTGNIKVYGSMLMKQGWAATGSLEVWFNEDLVKGNFPNKSWKLPRVYATARDTE